MFKLKIYIYKFIYRFIKHRGMYLFIFTCINCITIIFFFYFTLLYKLIKKRSFYNIFISTMVGFKKGGFTINIFFTYISPQFQ